MKKITTLVLSFIFVNVNVNAFTTIGTDGACDTTPNNLQSRINDNSINEIRITNQQGFDSISIHNKSIIIIGGYDNCTDAQNNDVSNTKSILFGDFNNPVITIDESLDLDFNVRLENLHITDGGGVNGAGIKILQRVATELINLEIRKNNSTNDGGGLYFSHGVNAISHTLTNTNINTNTAVDNGGGIFLGGGATVDMNDSIIDSNTAENGSGIYVNGLDNYLNLYNSIISSNSALQKGGGIYNFGSTVNIYGKSSINNNHATNGGGISMNNGAQLSSYSGDNVKLTITQYGIHHNTAINSGGGIYLESGSSLMLIGNSSHYANVTSNTATAIDSQGGGIYAKRDGTTISAVNTNISGNSASEGGAVYLLDRANLEMKRSIGACFDNQICSKISGNISNSGTLSAFSCGTFDIFQTEILNNFVESSALVRLLGNTIDNCKSIFEGNIFHHNSKANLTNLSSLFYISNKGELDFAFNTVTENAIDKVFRLSELPSNNQTLKLNSSIIWNNPALIITQGGVGNTFNGNCLSVHDDTLPAAFGNMVITLDPLFADALSNDYSLTNASPITDICDTALYQPITHDVAGKLRDIAFSGAVLGNYDLGAHEHASTQPIVEEVFLNGFE